MRFGANSMGFNAKKVEKNESQSGHFGERRSFSEGQSVATLCPFHGKQSEPVTTSGVCLGKFRLKQTQKGVSEPESRETSPSAPERLGRKKAFCQPTFNPHLSKVS